MSSEIGLYDDALIIFFDEAREMIQQFESCLLSLETEPGDSETINALFRAAHTIKGSAGVFGLERVVKFTHQVESVLDRVRNNVLKIDEALSEVLLKSCDMMAALLAQAESKSETPEMLAQLDSDALDMTARLSVYLGGQPHTVASGAAPAADNAGSAGTWHISLRFSDDAFRNGFDPLTVIHYLRSIGEIVSIAMVDDSLPEWESLDPESCYLGFEIRLKTAAARAEIDAAFEFVRDDCAIRMIPPNRRASDIIALLNELPHEKRLGDILVACGAVSRQALDDALTQQHATDTSTGGERRQPKQLGEILVEQKKVTPELVDAALSRQSKAREPKSDDSRFVRVPADKLDDLINLVGELVICGSSATLQAANAREAGLIETTQQMSGLVEEIRNGALSLRMVQIGETFIRYRRVVRDVTAELGKEVHLEIEGAETELDKSVVEKIGDPLMHLVRNSLDHGIELPSVREQAGKSPAGTIRLSASHDSGSIVIRVADDGRGLDGEMLLKKARERGLVAPGQILSESEKLNIIFAPGFSTAEKVTNLSGRGVGMDVVRKNIEALRGTVILDSVIGQGTTVEIRLPLTLAIIDGFLVKIGKSSFVIPLDSVVECIDADQQRIRATQGSTGHVDLRGGVLSFLDLRKIFSVTDDMPSKRSIVVVQSANISAGLLVDQLMGEYQTVIKPLGKLFQNLRGISGSTVLGSGEVALILDVPALLKLATQQSNRDSGVAQNEPATA